jgi:hypothetical protein
MKNKSFTLLGIFVAVLLVLSGCNFPGLSDKPGGSPAKKTTYTLEPAGGQVQAGDLALQFGQSSLPEPASIQIEQSASPAPEEDGVVAQSDTYHVTGLPPEFNGVVDVTVSIPAEILQAMDPSDPDRAGKISLLLGEPAYSPSGGGVTTAFAPLLDAQVDLEAKQIRARLDFSAPVAAGQGPASTGRNRPASVQQSGPLFDQWVKSPKDMYYMVRYYSNGLGETTIDKYQISFVTRRDDVGPLVDALKTVSQKLSQLGFDPQPITIYVEVPSWIHDYDGLFSWSLTRGYYVAIHPRLLQGGDEKLLLTTVGHELLHYAQLLTYKDLDIDPETYTSMDEATATWFESYLLSDPTFFDQLANNYSLYALYNPWFGGTHEEMQHAGYGASWYVTYLVNQYGDNFVRQAYNNGNPSGGKVAWALGLSDAYGIDNDLTFRQFLQAYFYNPDQVSPGLKTGEDYGEPTERILALQDTGGQLDFVPFQNKISTDAGTNFSTTKGKIQGDQAFYVIDPNPAFHIDRTLSSWNAYYVSLRVNKALIPQDKGQLQVSVSSSKPGSGVMVFAVARGDASRAHQALFGPENYLSSDTNSGTIIDNLSAGEGEGIYSEMDFILFNSGDEPSNVSLDVTFGLSFKPVFSSITCEGYFKTEVSYPPSEEAQCNYMPPGYSGCSDSVNPCNSSEGGGGGGGGGDVACLRMPDYCYQCMPDFGATFFYGLSTPGSSYMDNVVFDLQMDPDGNIIAFNWGQALFSGFNPVQTEFTGLPGAFTARYNISCPNVSVDKTPGYVAVNGSDIHFEVTDYGSGSYHDLQVTAVSGSGTWNLGHPVFGDTAVGTWSFHLGDAVYFSCSVQP